MPLVKGQCVNCGAILELDFNTKSGVCRHCGTPYISEDVINNYVTNHHYHIENANIEMVDESSSKKLLENAEVNFTQLGNYHKARELFAQVVEKSPGDYKGWWGLVRVDSDNFSNVQFNKKKLKEIECYADNAIKVAPVEVKPELGKVWKTYLSRFDDYVKGFLDNINDSNLKRKELQEENVKFGNILNERIERRNNLKTNLDELHWKKSQTLSQSQLSGYFFVLIMLVFEFILIFQFAAINAIMIPVFIVNLIIAIIYTYIIIKLKLSKNQIINEIENKTKEHNKLAEEITELLCKKGQISDTVDTYDESIKTMKNYIDKND